jgi:hypothetical protein
MPTITVYRQWIRAPETGDDGRKTGYYSLNASGRGRPIAEINGPITLLVKHYGPIKLDMAVLDDGTYSLRDALNFARAGTHSLRL